MRNIVVAGLMALGAFGLAGCYSSTTVEKPVIVRQPPPPPPQTTIITPGPGQVMCPAGESSC